MHFLLTALGSYGDVHPMVGLAGALVGRGHEVSLVVNPYFEDVVRAAGLDMVPLGRREQYLELVHHPDLWSPSRGPKLVMSIAGEQVRLLHEVIIEHCRPGETVLGAHGLDFASRIVGEQLGNRVVSINFAPSVFFSTHDTPRYGPGLWGRRVPRWLKQLQWDLGERYVLEPLVAPYVNQLRREIGLAPVRQIFSQWWHATDLVLCLFPEWFAPPQPDWPAETVLAGFPLWDEAAQQSLPTEVEEFLAAGAPPIVFTPGSANVTATSFFAAAVDACVTLNRRGILLTKYADQLPAGLPDSVRHFGFLPLSQVLPRAAAFVHHGGIGSSAQGLAAGVPQLVRPLAFDQFDNSSRLLRLGVSAEISVRRFRGPHVAAILARLVDSPEVARRCADCARRCNGARSLERACQAMEQLAATVLPQSTQPPKGAVP